MEKHEQKKDVLSMRLSFIDSEIKSLKENIVLVLGNRRVYSVRHARKLVMYMDKKLDSLLNEKYLLEQGKSSH